MLGTITDLVDARAKALDEIDDIINTAKEAERGLSPEERTKHDELVRSVEGETAADGTVVVDGLDAQIARATTEQADADRFGAAEARRARYSTVNVNTASTPATANRSLDELLWATNDTVQGSTPGAQNQVEQVAVRSADGNVGLAPRLREFRPEHRETVRSFQDHVATMAIAGMLHDRDAKSSSQGFQVARSIPKLEDQYQHLLRALDVDTAAEGTEWVPTGIGASVHEKVRAAGRIAPLFQRIDIPTNPWKWPVEGADSTAYRVAEPTTDTESKMTASTPGTAAVTFDAEIFGARTLISRSLDADSAVAIAPYTERKLVWAFVNAEEQAILDGDTDGTHMDSDAHSAGATDARWAWDGLRKKAIAQTVVTATSISTANLGAIRKGMGKWGLNPAELVFIVGVSSMHNILNLAEVLTVDKFGPNATILNGQVGSILGIPIVASEHVRENLNATGVYDAITTTKTYVLCVNRNEWAMGQRMALDIETDESIYRETFQRVMVGFMREDFQCIGSASTDENTAIAYNVTP